VSDPTVARLAYLTALDAKVSGKCLLALFEAGCVESNFTNVYYGDRDSLGFLQQRAAGWGPASERMDPVIATRKFLAKAKRLEHNYSTAGALAQGVQVSAFPHRYAERQADAARLLETTKKGIMSAASAIADLTRPSGGIDHQIYLASAEIINAAARAGHPVAACSWYNPASTPEHHVPGMAGSKGVAVDFMVYGNKAAGDWLADYVWANRTRLGVCWEIWYHRIRSTSPGRSGNWTPYNGPSPHTDHVHVNFGHLVGQSGYGNVSKISYHAPGHPTPPKPPGPDPDKPMPAARTANVAEMRAGSKNRDSVWWAQHWLNWASIKGSKEQNKTRNWDGPTIANAKAFQRQYSDPKHADGNLGPKEAAKLQALARKRAAANKKTIPAVRLVNIKPGGKSMSYLPVALDTGKSAPIEAKTFAAPIGGGLGFELGQLVIWILGVTVFDAPATASGESAAIAAVPGSVSNVIQLVLAAGLAFGASWLAHHTPRAADIMTSLDLGELAQVDEVEVEQEDVEDVGEDQVAADDVPTELDAAPDEGPAQLTPPDELPARAAPTVENDTETS
jgi:hypothetical protein